MSATTTPQKKAVCLFSGGLDSTTVLWMARQSGYQLYALTVYYGQRHGKEIDCARKIAVDLNIEHQIVPIELPWKGSSLLDSGMPVPVHREFDAISQDIPATYVPARNSIFLSMSASYAEVIGAETIFIGVNALDYSGYPDCRPEYLSAFGKALAAGTKAGMEGRKLEILAPLLSMTKKEIIIVGHRLGVPFDKTWSCYQGMELPCGCCDSCLLRRKGFLEAGLADPLMEQAAHVCR